MALIKCPKCGHTISDKAKQCPKCGHIIAHNNGVPQNNMPQDDTPSSNKTNAAVLAVLIICILALAVIICCVVIPASNGNKSAVIDTDSAAYADTVIYDNYTYPKEEDSDSIRAVEASSSNEPEIECVGTYTVTDELNDTWVFKLNADETATVQKKGSDAISYASLHDWRSINIGVGISFDEYKPNIVLPNGDTIDPTPVIRDGYLYANQNAAQSKNPQRRLKITKTN